ncbi:hypothetical protein, partial [Amycolatopsis japonica]
MIWNEAERDLLESVEAWFADILNELVPDGLGYRYSPEEVAEMSGGLVDAWMVEQLRGVARASWQARLTDDGFVTSFDRGVITEMLHGFVDAAVRAEPEALPSVRVVHYVAEGDLGTWEVGWPMVVESVVRPRLGEYWLDNAVVEHDTRVLLPRVGVQVVGVPVGDARIGTVHVDVDGQRPPGGMYGPETSYSVHDPNWNLHHPLVRARQALTGVDREDAVFTLARGLLDKYSEEPARFIGPATALQRVHEDRYEAAVDLLAQAIRDNPDVELTAYENTALDLANTVGLRRRRGVVGGESVPGGLVPLGVDVGRVRAGVVVGKLGSPVGRAARWLRREPGAFAVVVPGHGVPDADSVEAAVRAAGWNGSDTLRLFLCAQDGLAELAAELAERFQVRVSYAKGWVWLGMNPARWGGGRPAAQVAKIEYADDGSPLFTLRDDGTGWADKNPGGTEDEDGTPYLQTAPEQAPRLGLEQMIHLGPRTGSSAVTEMIVKWRPPADTSEPQTLKEFGLDRGIANWLQLSRFAEGQLDEDVKLLLDETRLGTELPLELLEMVRRQVELAPVAKADLEAWVDAIKDEMAVIGYLFEISEMAGMSGGLVGDTGVAHPITGYSYSANRVAEMSGQLVDGWVVEELRGVARASWQGRLIESGEPTRIGGDVVRSMLDGFVDAAVGAQTRHGVLPSVQGVLYVAEGDPGDLPWLTERVESRLNEYPSGTVSVSAEELRDRVDVRPRVLPKGDPRIGTALFQVRNQRPAGGLFGPAAYRAVADQNQEFLSKLEVADRELTGVAPEDAVFTQAREMVNNYNPEPSRVIGPASLRRSYEARYEAAVRSVAGELRRLAGDPLALLGFRIAEASANLLAFRLADAVGMRRRDGVLGGEDGASGGVPEQDTRPGSAAEPGWLVPVSDRVGIIEAGMVLGDADSKPGLAARWLPHEPGVFGVVITGDRVPDAATVVKALHDAGWNGKDAIRLFHSASRDLLKLALDLKDRLKVRVSYPQAQVWFGVDGDYAEGRPAARVAKIEYATGEPRVRLLEDGKGWVDRAPNGAEKPGAYVLTAPAQAPRLGLDKPVRPGPGAGTLPLPAVPAEVVGWRPPAGRFKPQTLREFLLTLDNLQKGVVGENAMRLLDEMPGGTKLPAELRTLISKQVEADPVPDEYVQAWLKVILNEMDPDGLRYRYSDIAVWQMSGGLVDLEAVEQLRGVARTDWHGRLSGQDGKLTGFARGTITKMLRGFVDAAVQAEAEALPSARGVLYVAEGDPSLPIAELRLLAEQAVEDRLNEYPSEAVPDEGQALEKLLANLLARVGFWIRVVPQGDSRAGTARFHVDGQRLLDGWYGPEGYTKAAEAKWWNSDLDSAREGLARAEVDREGPVFTRARQLVSEFNRKPLEFAGEAPLLHSRYRERYEAAVEILAWKLHRYPEHEAVAGLLVSPTQVVKLLASKLADSVGPRRRNRILGGDTQSETVQKSGGLVPVSARVGIVQAGVVLGDLRSPAGRAARWLSPEPGVFGVVIADHRVPDVETVVKALHDAGWNGKDAVRLFFFAQEGLAELADGLEAQLKVWVSYPDEQLWFGVEGDHEAGPPAARVGQIEYIGDKPWLRLRKDGAGWIDKGPGGKEKPGTYVMSAPAQEPRLGLKQKLHLGPQAPAVPGPVPVRPLVPGNLVGWLPAEDGTGPRNLREYLREYPLLRAIAPWLGEADPGRALAIEDLNLLITKRSFRRLPQKVQEMVWRQLEADHAQQLKPVNSLLKGEAESALFGTRVGDLPRELLDMVWKEMERDLLESVEAWFVHILNEMDPDGYGYRYSPVEVAVMSGGLVDDWVVEQLRGVARASWQARLDDDGGLSSFDREVITEMLEGFADAAVRAELEALPSVRVAHYLPKDAPGVAVGEWRRLARNVVRDRLGEYWSDEEYVEHVANTLVAQVAVQVIEVPAGDARIDTVHVDVDGQRPPGGMYGPETDYFIADPNWDLHGQLLEARRRELADGGVDREDAVFTLARAMLNKYSEEPARFIGPATELQSMHEDRYEAAVDMLAWAIHRHPDLELTAYENTALDLANTVGLRRRLGVVGGESVPGGLVPVGVGVGRVRAGVVVGRLGSPVGRAARWLRREPGAFAVVVPGHGVPDADSVEAAVRAAGWNGSDTLRLFLCAQDGLAELAAELAERFQVRVSYAKGWVWLGMQPARWGGGRPAAQVAKIECAEDGSPLFTLRDDGTGWADKHPGGTEDEDGTPYLQSAPEQAPRLGLEQMVHLGPEAPATPAPAKPLVPGRLVGWRPARDESGRPLGPQTLRAYLREYPLLRGIVPWLRDDDQLSEGIKLLLLRETGFGRLPQKALDMIWRQVEADQAQQLKPVNSLLKGEAESPLAGTRLGDLPRELLDMVWKEMERDLLESVEAWFVHILNELNLDGYGYRYSPVEVAVMSGGLVDDWVVEQLRGFARASWQAQLDNDGQLSSFDRGVITEMLEGFVDAAERAEDDALPSVRVVHYASKDGPGVAVSKWHRLARDVVQSRLGDYWPDEADVEPVANRLLPRVSVQAIEVPAGDARIGTVHVDVDGQRSTSGLYGPASENSVDDPAWSLYDYLLRARRELADGGVDRGDAVFTLARALMNLCAQEPLRFIGPATELQRLHEAWYEAAVEILAWIVHGHPDDNITQFIGGALDLADSVGLRRRHGVVGGESVPGGLVPLGVGVGRVRAGVVVGRLGSPVGRAARWLRREPGAFAVVVPGHGVPDADSVEAAVRAA